MAFGIVIITVADAVVFGCAVGGMAVGAGEIKYVCGGCRCYWFYF